MNCDTDGRKLAQQLRDLLLRKYPWQIHFFNETVTREDVLSALEFLTSGKPLLDGEYVGQYEEQCAALLGGGSLFTFGSGRMGLYALLEAMGIGKGDEVVLPAFTCEAVVYALMYRGIKPVYADIEPFTFNVSPAGVERVLTTRTRAIIAQHTFGVPCDLESILAIAREKNLRVIEDCALALGSSYKGKPVGTLGDASMFSTDRSKLISTQWGGVAFTRDGGLAERVRSSRQACPHLTKGQVVNIALQFLLSPLMLSPYAYYAGRYAFNIGLRTKLLFSHRDNKGNFTLPAGYPCRLSNFQAFLGIGQLARLEETLVYRRRSVQEYLDILRGNGIILDEGRRQVSKITLRFSLLLKDRETFLKRWNRYFEVGRWFDSPAIGWYRDFRTIGYEKGSCPMAELVHEHIVNFPTLQRSLKMKRFLHQIMSEIKRDDLLNDDALRELADSGMRDGRSRSIVL